MNVDVSAEDLRERLTTGKIYPTERIERALENFFTEANLTRHEVLSLPAITFSVDGMRLYKRLTFVARDGRISRVAYPIFPPGSDAELVLEWLREDRRTRTPAASPGPAGPS